MKIQIGMDEQDVKEAIKEWISNHPDYSIDVNDDDITINTGSVGDLVTIRSKV